MLRRRLLPLSVLLVAAAWSSPAWADPKDDARRHFLAGLGDAQHGDYQAALDEFLAAQNAWPHPNTLYNIARSYADLGKLEEAVRYYRLYQAAAPEKAADVDPVLAVLTARLAERDTPTPPPPEPTAPAPSSASPADVRRLAEIATELQAIQARLATGAPPVGPPEPTAEVSPPPAEPAATPPAAEPALRSDAYERVVVTASRYGQAPLDAPSTVTILTAEDIRQSGATNLPEVLRRVAGVDVMEMTAGQPDVSIRGFNRELSNKVLVLVDGRAVYLDVLGTVLWSTLPITLEEIERIEVIRGPGSAVYGADAVTGVVNLITRTPGEGPSLATTRVGTDGYVHGAAVADGRHDRTTWRLAAGYDQVARWSDNTPDSEAFVPLLDDQTWAARGAHADGRVDVGFSDKGLLSFSGGYGRGTDDFFGLGSLGEYAIDYTSGWARADAAYGPGHLRVFYNNTGGETGPWAEQAEARTLDSTFDENVVDAELEGNGELHTGAVTHRLNGGLGYRLKSIAWDYFGTDTPIVEHHFSAFGQEEAKIGPVAVVASLRADKHPLVPLAETLSPRGAVILHLGPERSLRLIGGSAFREPSFLESYCDLPLPTDYDGAYVNIDGSTLLHPERILTGEVGFHDESSAYHRADVAAYVNRVTDLIYLTDARDDVTAYDPETNGYQAKTTSFANLPEVYTAMGGEVDGRIFPTDGLDLYANASIETILVAEGAPDEATTDGSEPLLKLNVGAVYRTPWRIDLSAHAQYASAQTWGLRDYAPDGTLVTTSLPVDPHTIVSARIAGRPFRDEKLELAVSGWNLVSLLSGPVREHPKGQLVSERLWGEVTWRF